MVALMYVIIVLMIVLILPVGVLMVHLLQVPVSVATAATSATRQRQRFHRRAAFSRRQRSIGALSRQVAQIDQASDQRRSRFAQRSLPIQLVLVVSFLLLLLISILPA